ncbi:hypothetical protein RQP46_004775 [Phenoliferia psychrophenolica]
MGRSAKMMKRPNKAEKVARTVNAPPRAYQRSVSPEVEAPRSAIPLFNTSAKRMTARLADYDPMSLDSSKAPSPAVSVKSTAMELEEEDAEAASGKPRKKSSFKDKIKTARADLEEAEVKGKSKLSGKPGGKAGDKKGHVLGGTDYLKQFESRPGGFKKKLR